MKTAILIFPDIDQLDCTGPFEVLSRIPGMTLDLVSKTMEPVIDMKGLKLSPTADFKTTSTADVLVIPGGYGQFPLMTDAETIDWIGSVAQHARFFLFVCTGSLLAGMAGLLKERRATTHWSAHHLLKHFGAHPVDERVVHDGAVVTTAGVTGGIDGALYLAALIAGEQIAQEIQLYMEYEPVPPFRAGTPKLAPPTVLAQVSNRAAAITEQRRAVAQAYQARQETK
jgi:cyclohexyl-isocyanide hydratase